MKLIKRIEEGENTFTIHFQDSSLKLKSYTYKDNFYIDIANLNIIKAIKVAISVSTHCFLNEFQKNICWLVRDIETKHAISILCLKNTKCFVKEQMYPSVREIA